MANEKRNLDRLLRSTPQRPEKQKTPEEILLDMALAMRHASDPVTFSAERLKFTPDPWQARLLRSRSRKIIVNVARQNGKSDTAAVKAVHRAVFHPKSLILIVAPAIPQAAELRRKVDDHLRQLRDIQSKAVADNKRELELSNGSRIVILAADEDTVRSYTADLIIEDESATVPDAVFEAMKPMLLVRQGQHILLGTPKGLRTHHFPDIWHDEKSDWEKYQVTAWDNPRVTKWDLEQMREEATRLGRLWVFQQEYECSFIAAAQGLVYPFTPSKNTTVRLDLAERHGWQFVLGIDYGYTDSTAFVVLGWQPNDPNVYVIESMDKTGLTPAEAAELALAYTKKYPFARMVGDVGGLGKGYVEEARRRFRLPIEAAEKNNKRGYIEIMAGDMRAGLLKVFPGNERLLDEWGKLPWDEEREMPADGHKDHLSDACLYAYRATLHYLEEVRKNPPARGTPEADKAEAEEMFAARMRDVTKAGKPWWSEGEEGWPEVEQVSETTWLN